MDCENQSHAEAFVDRMLKGESDMSLLLPVHHADVGLGKPDTVQILALGPPAALMKPLSTSPLGCHAHSFPLNSLSDVPEPCRRDPQGTVGPLSTHADSLRDEFGGLVPSPTDGSFNVAASEAALASYELPSYLFCSAGSDGGDVGHSDAAVSSVTFTPLPTGQEEGSVLQDATSPNFLSNEGEVNFDQQSPRRASTRGADGMFGCGFCDMRFKQTGNRKKHIEETHMRRKPFSCAVCLATFSRKHARDTHQRAVHEQLRPHECPYCHKLYKNQSDLNKHIRTVERRDKPFACETCGRSFGERGKLRRHVAIHVKAAGILSQ
jgi:uncharacterized Zn-finger protein